MTTKSRDYPTRIKIDFEKKAGWIVLDQIREIEIIKVKNILKEMLVD